MAKELIFDLYGIEAREEGGYLEVEACACTQVVLTPEEAAILGAHLQGWAVQHGVICETAMVPIEDLRVNSILATANAEIADLRQRLAEKEAG